MVGSTTYWLGGETLGGNCFPDWSDTCCDKIINLSELKENWNSYGAKPVNEKSIKWATIFAQIVSMYGCIHGIPAPRVAASPEGNVGLSWEWDSFNQEIDIEIYADGSINYAYVNERDADLDREGTVSELMNLAVLILLGCGVAEKQDPRMRSNDGNKNCKS